MLPHDEYRIELNSLDQRYHRVRSIHIHVQFESLERTNKNLFAHDKRDRSVLLKLHGNKRFFANELNKRTTKYVGKKKEEEKKTEQ